MNTSLSPTVLLFALPLLLLGINPQAASASPPPGQAAKGTYLAPDNQPGPPPGEAFATVASNAAGTTDKTLVLTPKTDSDKQFNVIVYNATTGETQDVVEYSPGNTPPVVIPPGSKAAVQDDPDTDTKEPEGTSALS